MPDKEPSATPLYKKLGIKPGARLSFVDPPPGFLDALELPPDVAVDADADELDVVLLFATRFKVLRERFETDAARISRTGGLWIAYPKKSSRLATDLNFDNVQQLGLEAGLVDNKSCAVSADYSGVRFVLRVQDR